ncbi:hypothetical protein PVK06_043723 [Gossypium arboreum]|uniref:Uncharacterized protein n=1 Tax=Gossypium arboreum TaxID=29729 RepID=A0ABR0MPA5_GOSAR|nr:hypothetical protein PVK06_043723 [Gossypium arboreum]
MSIYLRLTTLKTEIDRWHLLPSCKSLIITKMKNLVTLRNIYVRLIACSGMVYFLIKRTLLLRRKLMLPKKKLLSKWKLLLRKKKLLKIFVEKVVTVPGSMGANIDNYEKTGVRLAEVAEVTNEGQCNSWEIMVYTGPLKWLLLHK